MKKNYSIPLLLILTAFIFTHRPTSAQTIAGGGSHSLFVCTDSTARACGLNAYGQYGDGTTSGTTSPVQVSGLTGITAVAGGNNHSLFLKNDGTVWACGMNGNGQLGDGTTTNGTTPVQVSGLTGITAVAGGDYHSLFLKNDGTVWACGSNNDGQLGDGTTTDRTTSVQVSGLTDITAVAGGKYHSLFLKNDGTVWACGSNSQGQLGDGTTTNRTNPVQVGGLTGIIAVAAGHFHSLFLKNDGTVWACGRNVYGQLGDGTTAGKTTPVQVSGLTGITTMEGGGEFSLFLKNNGTVWSCGLNNYGQLGDGTTTGKTTPVQVSGLTGITAVAAGTHHSLFLKNDGTVWACGYNFFAQLGDGTTTNRNTPVQTINLCLVAQPGGNCNPLPAAVAENSGPVCADATSFTLNETGGDANSWSWSSDGAAVITNTADQSPTVTGFADGDTFIVMVTDSNGCQNTDSIQIAVNPLPLVSANATLTTLCEGESITLSGSGAQSYTWDNGVSDGVSFVPASSNLYTVTGTDANGCNDTDTIQITVNSLPAVSANATLTTLCDGESTTLSGSGAQSYSWDNGVMDGVSFAPASSGTYSVTGTDANGCMDTASIAISVNPVYTENDAAEICSGDSYTLPGGNVVSVEDVYYDTLQTIQSCDSVIITTLTVNTVDVSVSQSSNTLTANNPNASYEWFNCNNATPPAGNINDQTFVATENGDYGVILTENGCVDTSTCYSITSIGIIENDFSSSLAVYPNPASEKLNIDLGEHYPKIMVSVQDMQGKLLIHKNFDGQQQLELNLNDLANGVYMVNITAGEKRAVVKVVKH